MKLLNILNKVIEYSFYLLFFLVPLALTGDTSELFEFNKMWITFIITIIIATAWIFKTIIKKEIRIQRTPLDIPIALFLGSQILSTIFSLDPHVSLWGYYSRFNGGLLSLFSYVFLFYAFVSNYKDFGSEEEKENPIKSTQIGLFILGIVVFFVGNILSSLFTKTISSTFFPVQMSLALAGAITSFAIFMKAAPSGILKKSFYAIFTSAVMVVVWGLPSHFGFDPTCLLFRGSLDVSCWTADFQPKIRLFSTLGQPDWLAAYLVALMPVSIAILLNFVHGKDLFKKANLFKNYYLIFSTLLVALIGSFYLMLLYTISRSAILAGWFGLVLLFAYYFWVFVRPKLKTRKFNLDFKFAVVIIAIFAIITFLNGQPFSQFDILTWKGIHGRFFVPKPTAQQQKAPEPKKTETATPPPASRGELGGTDSRIIRYYVWEGAVDIWKNYPIFGSGVETYAFAFYKYKPVGHNTTSEWNYLYNKAHNEFLNYLATTGTVGIITYLFMIGSVLFLSLRFIWKNLKIANATNLLIYSLIIGYLGILITNMLGFSVVIISILFFLIPAFILILTNSLNFEKTLGFSLIKNAKSEKVVYSTSGPQKGALIITAIIALYLIIVLARFWQADRYYYYGLNLDKTGDFQRAYGLLQEAVNLRPSEPIFRDEFAINNAIVGATLIYQNQQQPNEQNLASAKQLIQTAIDNSNRLVTEHPNNTVFAKSRIRLFYTLSQVDQSYLPLTLEAIKKAKTLAPLDPDVSYNLGVLYGQTGDLDKAITELKNTIKLKDDYSNAYYALAVFYHQKALDKNGKVVDEKYAQLAIDEIKKTIAKFGSNEQLDTALKTWTSGQ